MFQIPQKLFVYQPAKSDNRLARFLLITIQLGLQVQVGHDVSLVKDDVSAVKEAIHLSKASHSRPGSQRQRACRSHYFVVRLVNCFMKSL